MRARYHLPYLGPVLEYRDTGKFPWVRSSLQASVVIPFKYWYVNHFLGAKLTGGGQLTHASRIISENLWKGETSLIRSLRGPPPGAASVLLFGTYIANQLVDTFLPEVSIENQYA